MAFESLSDRFSAIFKKMRGQATLTEKNMDDMLKEIRVALLEADVNFKVVKNFISRRFLLSAACKREGEKRRRQADAYYFFLF